MTPTNTLKHFVSYQPVATAIHVPGCVLNYQGGILSQNDCYCQAENYSEVVIDANFLIVGYGNTQETDKEYPYCSGYWILRSSWGTAWGD
jgi:hypothetical protein